MILFLAKFKLLRDKSLNHIFLKKNGRSVHGPGPLLNQPRTDQLLGPSRNTSPPHLKESV